MDNITFSDLHNKAEEFCSITRLVNESSKLRKKHSEEAINLIKQSLEIGDILNHEFEIISRSNKTMREQDTMVQNYCLILDSNISRQIETIGSLKNGSSLGPAQLTQLSEMAGGLSASLNKAIMLLQMIIQNDNDIILMDNLIMNRKRFQRDSIDQLKKLAFRTLEDANSAVRGSASNLKRGIHMSESLKKVRQPAGEGSGGEIQKLIDESNTGWNTAVAVNRSSITQLEFAEQVNRFTLRLHEDSIAIRDLVVAKHELFYRNLELTTELTVILSLEIKDFLPAREIVEAISIDADLSGEIRYLAFNLISYVTIACKDINIVSNLNFDMTDSINLNADLEKKSVDLTKIELEYFDRIREEVTSMTEATKYPIEGSERNVEIGKHIETTLRRFRKKGN
jgi:hypothetical protein